MFWRVSQSFKVVTKILKLLSSFKEMPGFRKGLRLAPMNLGFVIITRVLELLPGV